MSDPAQYLLERTGDAPLTFSGSLVASASSQQPPTKRGRSELETHWHELTLYQTTGGQHVAAVAYRSTWPGELEASSARAGTLTDCVDWLRSYEPDRDVQGFPSGRGFAPRQERLLALVRHGYFVALGKLLAGLGVSETID